MTKQPPPPESHLPLHPLEFRILMILMQEPSHGYAVVQEIEASGGTPEKIYPANLYRRIRNLLARGLIEDTPTSQLASPDSRRRYFKLTPAGGEVVRAEARRLQELLSEAQGRGVLPELGG